MRQQYIAATLKMTQIADSGKMITWHSQKQYASKSKTSRAYIYILVYDGIRCGYCCCCCCSLYSAKHVICNKAGSRDIVFNENLLPEPEINFHKRKTLFYSILFMNFRIYIL